MHPMLHEYLAADVQRRRLRAADMNHRHEADIPTSDLDRRVGSRAWLANQLTWPR
jgi:hypothetical protein